MNKELIESLSILEREKGISKDVLFDAIENSLLTACKNHFGKADTENIKVEIDRETGDFKVFVEKQVVETEEEVTDPMMFITLDDAVKIAFINYCKESYVELTQKVTWPSWQELQARAGLVMIATVIIAIALGIIDFAFQNLMTAIYKL